MVLLHVLFPTSTKFDASRIEYLLLNADSDNILWEQQFFLNIYKTVVTKHFDHVFGN